MESKPSKGKLCLGSISLQKPRRKIIINPSWYVTEWSKPVYAWNDTDAPKVALLDRGTQFPILRDEGDWYVISLRGAVGWIYKD